MGRQRAANARQGGTATGWPGMERREGARGAMPAVGINRVRPGEAVVSTPV
jgi:hypothetical protein